MMVQAAEHHQTKAFPDTNHLDLSYVLPELWSLPRR